MDDNCPLSELYAEIGEQWAKADAHATILEDTKSAFLNQRIMELIQSSSMAHNRAESQVKASEEWVERIRETVGARLDANLLWVKLNSIKMAHSEWQSDEANQRVQARL